MRFVLVALALSLLFAGNAFADDHMNTATMRVCPPACCDFSCMVVDFECCGYVCSTEPATVEFLNCDEEVIASAVIDEQWCGGCYDEHFVTFDETISTNDIAFVRITTMDMDCASLEWASIRVLCEDCGCGDWKTLFKGDICWW